MTIKKSQSCFYSRVPACVFQLVEIRTIRQPFDWHICENLKDSVINQRMWSTVNPLTKLLVGQYALLLGQLFLSNGKHNYTSDPNDKFLLLQLPCHRMKSVNLLFIDQGGLEYHKPHGFEYEKYTVFLEDRSQKGVDWATIFSEPPFLASLFLISDICLQHWTFFGLHVPVSSQRLSRCLSGYLSPLTRTPLILNQEITIQYILS